MDQALRILAGEEPVPSENTPLRIFDESNIEQAGVPPALGTGYGDQYIAGYRELWGLDE
jgi:ribose transport system substrate-binding protein